MSDLSGEPGEKLARHAVLIVSQAEAKIPAESVRTVTHGLAALGRARVVIPFDKAMADAPFEFDKLAPATRVAWLEAASAVANGLSLSPV